MTDTERLNFLEMLLNRLKYTGNCVLRDSVGRGFRLHESSHEHAVNSVRKAIDDAHDRYLKTGDI